MTLFLLITWAILLGVLLRDLHRTEQPTQKDDLRVKYVPAECYNTL